MINMLEAQEGTTLVLFSDEWGISIWWNNSATFNVWRDGVEVDVFTNYTASEFNCRELAREWFEEAIV